MRVPKMLRETTPLSIDFNDSQYKTEKTADAVLTVKIVDGYGTEKMMYDFNSRLLITQLDRAGGASNAVLPFSQLDRESLAAMHKHLKEDLNGNPPPLPQP